MLWNMCATGSWKTKVYEREYFYIYVHIKQQLLNYFVCNFVSNHIFSNYFSGWWILSSLIKCIWNEKQAMSNLVVNG